MDDLGTRLREALTGRYAITRETGRGGMATVFLAQDLRHDRDVALKLLHPWVAEGVGGRRFEQEIRLAARLQHPHIVPVHDSGVVPAAAGEPDLLWFSMPFVEGESLRDRLRREGQLPVADAVRITRQVADALEYAHQHGVIHRDVKPENILLTGNHAMVSDFGIALAAERAVGGVTDTLTAVGTTVGTVAYMSPEQSSAERTIDGRSDQYSLASVLYEMLVGETPFTGPTSQVIMQRRMTEEPRALRASRAGVPESLERTVTKALARLPADRFATMAEFGAALDGAVSGMAVPAPVAARVRHRTWGGIAAAVVLIALAVWRLNPGMSNAAGLGIRMAVLPFQLTGDSADAYFAEGMADEVSVKLTNVPGFQMIARSSASQYARMDKPLQQIAEELRVQFLLTGKVTWLNRDGQQRVIVRTELVEVTRQNVLNKWADTFDGGEFSDVFEVQSAIAIRIAGALRVAITPETRAVLAAAPKLDSAAYNEFLRGEHAYLQSGPEYQEEALTRYESAVARDTTFARAWARLSMVNSSIYQRTVETHRAVAARRAAERALALDPTMADAHLAMGNYYALTQSEYLKANESYQAGLRLKPDHADLLNAVGLALQGLGRYDEGISQMQRALLLDPRSSLIARRLTRALTYAHRFAEAEEVVRLAISLNPTDASAHQYAVLNRLAQGDLAGARALIRAIPKAALERMLPYWSTNDPIHVWFLDDQDKTTLLALPREAWGRQDGRLAMLQVLAFRRGDLALARVYADSVGRHDNYRPVDSPDPVLAVLYASWAVLAGDKADAIRRAEAAMASSADDQVFGTRLRHNVINVYLMAGDHERALNHLEILVRQKYQVTPAWLRIDPMFDPIRSHPRFQQLLALEAR